MRLLVEGQNREVLLEERPLARGGEAAIYALCDEPAHVAKVYHRPTTEHAGKLAALLAAAPPAPPRGTHSSVIWPLARLLAPNPPAPASGPCVVGYLMPRVAAARPLCEIYNPRARRQACPLFHYGYLLRTARNLAAAVRELHENGHVVGDLNESNVLVTPQALVSLVDADSFQLKCAGRVHRCRVGKPEYLPPHLQGVDLTTVDRGLQDDAFALAVLIFQLLMQGLHPFAGMYGGTGEPPPLPERIAAGWWPYAWEAQGPFQPIAHAPPWCVLPPAVQELFSDCFEAGHASPERRPGASAWQQALEEAEAGLIVCPANVQHHFPRGLDVCPWCVLARAQDGDPFPSPEQVRALQRDEWGTGSAERRRTPIARSPQPVSGSLFDPTDPRPPRSVPAAPPVAAASAAGTEEGALAHVGTWVERQPWLIWAAAASVGALLGILAVVYHFLSF